MVLAVCAREAAISDQPGVFIFKINTSTFFNEGNT